MNGLEKTMNQAPQMKRNISAYSEATGKKTFQSNATTWGELKSEMQNLGFSFNNMKVSEGMTQTDLTSDNSILPSNFNYRGQITNDLVIVLTTKKNISSGMDYSTMPYKELKAAIKAIFDKDKDAGREHFGNYTQLSTDRMRELLGTWGGGSSKTKKNKPEPVKREAPKSKTKKAVAKNKATKAEPVAPSTPTTTECTCDEDMKKAYKEAIGHFQTGLNILTSAFKEPLDSRDIDDIINATRRR